MTVLPTTGGCDLDDDGKPNNVFGRLIAVWPEIGAETKDHVEKHGLALVYRACTGEPADQWESPETCKSPPGWLPVPVSATTQLPITIQPGVWQGDVTGTACPARIQVSEDYYHLAPSAPLWLPIALPYDVSHILSVPVISTVYRNIAPLGVTLCGVVRKDQLTTTLGSVSADIVAKLGGKAQFETLVFSALPIDIDTDDDGKKDAISIAVQIELEPFDPKDAILLSTGLSTPVSQTEVP